MGALALAAGLLLSGCGGPPTATFGPGVAWGSDEQAGRAPAASAGQAGESGAALPAASGKELPRGGATFFPRYRLFGYVGYPGAAALGRLGTGDLEERVAEIEQKASEFAGGREVMPVMELIASVAHNTPGDDGLYRSHVSDEVITTWLAMARKHRAILLLDIQPGRAAFLDEVKFFAKWLAEPDVGIALDPEWAVGPTQVPGRQFGTVAASDLDACAAYVAGIVREKGLPEKVFLYHQLHPQIVTGERALKEHDGIVLIKSVDGIGSRALKTATYKQLVKVTPAYVHLGFKLFYEEDTRKNGVLMTPAEVLALDPQPEYVLFE